jgi:hypothetical protein
MAGIYFEHIKRCLADKLINLNYYLNDMAKKSCGVCMCTLCSTFSGVIVLAAGVALILSALSMLDSITAGLIAGAALAIYGLGFLAHAANACPLCK